LKPLIYHQGLFFISYGGFIVDMWRFCNPKPLLIQEGGEVRIACEVRFISKIPNLVVGMFSIPRDEYKGEKNEET
jgi:hypothetical protein